MRLRLAKISENELENSIKASVWGSRQTLKTWKTGDILILYVNNEIASAGFVCGDEYESREPVWDNGDFPNRVPIDYTHYFRVGNRIPLEGPIKSSLYDSYGPQYGVIILNKYPIDESIAELIWDQVTTKVNDIADFINPNGHK